MSFANAAVLVSVNLLFSSSAASLPSTPPLTLAHAFPSYAFEPSAFVLHLDTLKMSRVGPRRGLLRE